MGAWHNGTLQCLTGELGNASMVLPEHPQTTLHGTLDTWGVWEWIKKLNPVLRETATVQLSSGEMPFSQGVLRSPQRSVTQAVVLLQH